MSFSPPARWPTGYEIWDLLQRGLPIDLPEVVPEETPDVQQKRHVDSAWIVALLGSTKDSVGVPIVIRNAIMVGALRLHYVTFQHDFRIENCVLKDTIDLSFSVFKKAAVFDGSRFENRVLLNGIRTQADLKWKTTDFGSELECQDATIGRNLSAEGAVFRSFDFEGSSIGGVALFKDEKSRRAEFRGDATFDLVQINGGLQIQSAEFQSEVTFTAATIKNFADFRNAIFRGKAQFDGASFLGDAKFDAVQFVPKKPDTDNDDKDVDTELIRFPGVRIAGQAVFDNCLFAGSARFDQTHFESEAFFESAKFSEDVRFDGASFAGPASFEGASFVPNGASNRIDFRGAKGGSIDFTGAHFSGGTVTFQDAAFRVVYFHHESEAIASDRQLPLRGKGGLDLRGFTYERIFMSWREALEILEPYDVQPYRQLERALRTMGKDHEADDVYLQQRWRAFRNSIQRKQWLVATGLLIYGCVLRFGVKPWRLAGISILLLLCSVAIFHQPNATEPIKDSACIAHQLDPWEAFGVSLNYFLPIQVPVSACYAASTRTAFEACRHLISFALWATILKILGWIFVPLGVAALGGLLRQPSSK